MGQWQCKQSGTWNPDTELRCSVCGKSRYPNLTLVSCETGKQTEPFRISTSVGRGLLAKLESLDIKYVSTTQFLLKRDEQGEWSIWHDLSAKNQTFLNGQLLTTATPLKDGAKITIGPEKFPISVNIK